MKTPFKLRQEAILLYDRPPAVSYLEEAVGLQDEEVREPAAEFPVEGLPAALELPLGAGRPVRVRHPPNWLQDY